MGKSDRGRLLLEIRRLDIQPPPLPPLATTPVRAPALPSVPPLPGAAPPQPAPTASAAPGADAPAPQAPPASASLPAAVAGDGTSGSGSNTSAPAGPQPPHAQQQPPPYRLSLRGFQDGATAQSPKQRLEAALYARGAAIAAATAGSGSGSGGVPALPAPNATTSSTTTTAPAAGAEQQAAAAATPSSSAKRSSKALADARARGERDTTNALTRMGLTPPARSMLASAAAAAVASGTGTSGATTGLKRWGVREVRQALAQALDEEPGVPMSEATAALCLAMARQGQGAVLAFLAARLGIHPAEAAASSTTSLGETILHEPAWHGHLPTPPAIAHLCLCIPVDRPLTDGRTALLLACAQGRAAAAAYLVEARGADLWARDAAGRGVLHHCVEAYRECPADALETARCLLRLADERTPPPSSSQPEQPEQQPPKAGEEEEEGSSGGGESAEEEPSWWPTQRLALAVDSAGNTPLLAAVTGAADWKDDGATCVPLAHLLLFPDPALAASPPQPQPQLLQEDRGTPVVANGTAATTTTATEISAPPALQELPLPPPPPPPQHLLVRRLLTHRNRQGLDAFAVAARSGQSRLLAFILETVLTWLVNTVAPPSDLPHASVPHDLAAATYGEEGAGLLHLAVRGGSLPCVETVARQLPISLHTVLRDAEGRFPQHLAATNRRLDMLKCLAGPPASLPLDARTVKSGRTVLHIAASLSALVEVAASISSSSSSSSSSAITTTTTTATASSTSTSGGGGKSKSKGAKPKKKSKKEKQDAKAMALLGMVEWLVEDAGMDVTEPDGTGKDALALATAKGAGNSPVARYLKGVLADTEEEDADADEENEDEDEDEEGEKEAGDGATGQAAPDAVAADAAAAAGGGGGGKNSKRKEKRKKARERARVLALLEGLEKVYDDEKGQQQQQGEDEEEGKDTVASPLSAAKRPQLQPQDEGEEDDDDDMDSLLMQGILMEEIEAN